jgi:multisubunit Na+/H+ antiporter MnhE subunit
MANTVGDYKLASTAAGFTLGFGVLCVWNAIQQTRSLRSPLRSVYIYMVWGEIVANLAIAVIAWLFLDGTLGPGCVTRNG